MKVGDLVRKMKPKGYWRSDPRDHLAVIVEVKESNGYRYPKFMMLESGKIESCCFTLLEVINENR
mgnify:CR=1 FL=1